MIGITTNDPSLAVGGNIYESLLRYDEKLQPMPSLAKSWTISEGGLTYPFTLQDDVPVPQRLGKLKRELDLSLVFITHDLRVAAQICDRSMVMQQGEVVELGTGSESFETPAHPSKRSPIEAVPGRAKQAFMVY
jgi:hypothetical protein